MVNWRSTRRPEGPPRWLGVLLTRAGVVMISITMVLLFVLVWIQWSGRADPVKYCSEAYASAGSRAALDSVNHLVVSGAPRGTNGRVTCLDLLATGKLNRPRL